MNELAKAPQLFLMITVFIACSTTNNNSIDLNKLNNLKSAFVERVIDGDTIVVVGHKIRVLNIDTPESVHPKLYRNSKFGAKVSRWAKRTLEHKPVSLKCLSRDRYRRLLCYVFVNGENYSTKVIKMGYSKYYTKYGISKEYHKDFKKAETEAIINKTGIWKINSE